MNATKADDTAVGSGAPVSAFLVILNESAHLEEAISSLSWCDEVIVVDSGSSDGSQAIARGLGARVIDHPWQGYSAQKAFALSQCRNEWCINIDGDEVVPTALQDELALLIEADDCDAVCLRIDDLFMGAIMHRWSRRRSIVRVFKKSAVSYPTDRQVHENVVVSGRTATARQHLFHYGYDDPNLYLTKYIRYAELRAADKFRRGKRGSWLKLSLVFPATFIKSYFLRGLCWSGTRGLVAAVIEATYGFMKEANLLRLGWQQSGSRGS
jgi:glycosyltransferase involved in cell wall biosynthesis